jgi:acyl transferase domain-containing protein/acyl carrier protein
MQDDIAIIGMSVRLPGINDLDTFWEGLARGKDYIGKLSALRKKDVEDFYIKQGLSLPDTYPEAAYLEKIDLFDHERFRISKGQAKFIDPAHRLFLETAVHCFEDAGYMGKSLSGRKTGVFVGYGGEFEYKHMISEADKGNEGNYATGTLNSFITSRLCYLYDLKGPSMTVDTSCSSSLVALHLACNSLRAEECEIALVGGAQIYHLPVISGDIGIQSKDFRTRPFDDRAEGTGGGEGVLAILIKKYSKAIEDKDHIYALIKGSAVNSDGTAIGLTAPNPAAQTSVLMSAWKQAGISPETITYIEAHGTGTRLGDPIELKAATEAFKRFTTKRSFCAVSSVKSNLGHLGYAAGIAGIIKAVLQLQNALLVPTVHYENLNRNIQLDDSALFIQKGLTKWSTPLGVPKRCGVSSFGLSGTNCHVVLEEAPQQKIVKECGEHAFFLSADTHELLKNYINAMVIYIEKKNPSLSELCYTLALGREHLACKLIIVTQDISHLITLLKEAKENITVDSEMIFLPLDLDEKVKEKYKLFYLSKHDQQTIYKEKAFSRISLPITPMRSSRCWIEYPDRHHDAVSECPNEFYGFKKEEWDWLISKCAKNRSFIQDFVILLFRRYLDVEDINPDSDFFDLGGDSIMMYSLMSDINEQFKTQYILPSFIRYQTVKEITDYLYETNNL